MSTSNRPISSSSTAITQSRPLFHVRQQQQSLLPSFPRSYIPPRAFPPPHSLLTRQHAALHYASSTPPPLKGLPLSTPLVGSSPVSDSNGYKNSRDRSRDESLFVTVRDRKVRISGGASLYALCRSWLKNGLPEENQFQYGDRVKSLPRPLPLPVLDTHSPKKEEAQEVAEEEEKDEGAVDQLSPKGILKRHVKRAKKVRARLREERLKRIARYKTRLGLLLPPHVEQFRNDTVAGN